MPHTHDYAQQITQLAKAGHGCARIVTAEEPDARRACAEAAMTLGWKVVAWDLLKGIHDGLVEGAPPLQGTGALEKALTYMADAPTAALFLLLDAAPALRDDPKALRAWRRLVEKLDAAHGEAGTLVMIDHQDDAPDVVRRHSTPLELPLPSGEQVRTIVRAALRSVHKNTPIDVKLRTSELEAIHASLHGLSRRQIERIIRDVVALDRTLDSGDLAQVIKSKRRLLEGEGPLEAVEAPASLDEIGGLAALKAWLKQRTNALSEGARRFGIDPPRGVLLLGVQGAGKSLCAKAIATAWVRPLLRLDAGALYNKYIGESERTLRTALQQAEAMAPVILWIDEIEKAFAGSQSQGSDGGLSRRMLGALLTWMQERRAPVFLVATANDIEALPPELLRKGRFDEIFFVDLPSASVREQILAIHLKKRQRDPQGFDLPRAGAAMNGFSGAEIEQAVMTALHAAFAEGREVTTDDLVHAAAASPPLSTTRAEQIEALRAWGKERCRMAD